MTLMCCADPSASHFRFLDLVDLSHALGQFGCCVFYFFFLVENVAFVYSLIQ